MTSNVEAVAIANQRAKIPTNIAVTFEQMTNDELASMALDDKLKPDTRAYAGWELDYREAMSIEVYYDADADLIKRRKGAPLPVKEPPKADRSRWTLAGAEATIRRRMEQES